MDRVVWSEGEDKAVIAAVASGIAARHIDIPGRTLHSIQSSLHRLDIRPSSVTGKETGYAFGNVSPASRPSAPSILATASASRASALFAVTDHNGALR